VQDYLDIVYSFEYASISIRPWQVRSEIAALLELVQQRRPKVVLEIGTASGGTLFLFARMAAEDATLISIDLRKGKFGGGYPLWRVPFYHGFASDRQTVKLVRGDSHSGEVRERVSSLLGGRPVDVLFIDGDHTYEGVKSDFNGYTPLVANRGLIALHDIVPGTLEASTGGDKELLVGEVPQFWQELRDRFVFSELVEDWAQGAFGIGVLPNGVVPGK
jgi:cephalosporin hydroxylase